MSLHESIHVALMSAPYAFSFSILSVVGFWRHPFSSLLYLFAVSPLIEFYTLWHACQYGALPCRSHDKIKFCIYRLGFRYIIFGLHKSLYIPVRVKLQSTAPAHWMRHWDKTWPLQTCGAPVSPPVHRSTGGKPCPTSALQGALACLFETTKWIWISTYQCFFDSSLSPPFSFYILVAHLSILVLNMQLCLLLIHVIQRSFAKFQAHMGTFLFGGGPMIAMC